MDMVKASAEGIGICNMMADYERQVRAIVYADSSAAIAISKRRGSGELRHISVGLLWIQEKEKDGTIETLTRQLVQAGIKAKVLQGASEVDKTVHATKGRIEKSYLETDSQQKTLRAKERLEVEKARKDLQDHVANFSHLIHPAPSESELGRSQGQHEVRRNIV